MNRATLPRPSLSPPLVGFDSAVFEALLQPCLSLFWGAYPPARPLLAALTITAGGGRSPRLFDGGNRFDGYFVARLARRLNPDPQAILGRIRLSRAFTCFQLAELIASTPPDREPLFVLDLLATFYDESVPLRDAERLLAATITHLKRLANAGPVIVGAREPQTLVKERWTLLDQLQVAADAAWLSRGPEETPAGQMRLF